MSGDRHPYRDQVSADRRYVKVGSGPRPRPTAGGRGRRFAEEECLEKSGMESFIFDMLLCLDTYVGRRRMDKLVGGCRKRNLDSLLARAERVTPNGCEKITRVPTLTALTPEEFQRGYLKPMKPVVMKGLAKDFPAIGKWSPEFFKERFGDESILTIDGKDRTIEDRTEGVARFHTAEWSTWR